MSAERIYRWFDKTGCEWMTSDGEAAEKAANSLGANIEVYLPLTDHEAAMKALRDVSRQFGDAEAELAKLREALTPNADTKAAYSGKFSMGVSLRLGREEEHRRVQIPWDTIKEIMTAICARALSCKNSG